MKPIDSLPATLAPFWAKYPYPVVQLREESPRAVCGFVLTRKQVQELHQLLPDYTLKLNILEEASGAPLYLGKDSVLNLYTDPTQSKLSTQWEDSEPPLKEMIRSAGFSLVQKQEKTLGWVLSEQLILAEVSKEVPPSSFSREAFVEEAERHLEISYCLGGRSFSGIDCSGLVQRALWNACHFNYPRHSRDQMKQGIRCDRGQERRGDLIFARPYLKGELSSFFHVAIFLNKDTLLHACRSLGKVVQMSFSEFFTRYAYAGSRCIPEFS
ncbi:MAG: NlpC/P60 family protein [Planctomycetota bacterium]